MASYSSVKAFVKESGAAFFHFFRLYLVSHEWRENATRSAWLLILCFYQAATIKEDSAIELFFVPLSSLAEPCRQSFRISRRAAQLPATKHRKVNLLLAARGNASFYA